jgi:hypothetical protein
MPRDIASMMSPPNHVEDVPLWQPSRFLPAVISFRSSVGGQTILQSIQFGDDLELIQLTAKVDVRVIAKVYEISAALRITHRQSQPLANCTMLLFPVQCRPVRPLRLSCATMTMP